MIMDLWKKCWGIQKMLIPLEEIICLLLADPRDYITYHFSFMKLLLPGGGQPNLTFRCSNQLIEILSRTISPLISSPPLRTSLPPKPSQVKAVFFLAYSWYLQVGGGIDGVSGVFLTGSSLLSLQLLNGFSSKNHQFTKPFHQSLSLIL